MEYLPEWKIYLWEKLLLDKQDDDSVRKISDFIYFNAEDQFTIVALSQRRTIALLEAVEQGGEIHLAGEGTSIDNSYYSFDSKKILSAFIELTDSKPSILKITEIKLGKGYIAEYRHERQEYLTQERRKSIASISSGKVRSEPNKNYFNDKFCGISEDIFNKAENSQELTHDDMKKLLSFDVDFLLNHLSFKLKISKESLVRKIHEYIQHFMSGDLIRPPKVRYYAYYLQKEKISASIELLTKTYGDKNLSLSLAELAEIGRWHAKEDEQFRFYESVLALWVTRQIKIHNLVKDEFIISLTDTFEATKPSGVKKNTEFNLEKTISAIKSPHDFEVAKKRWIPVKEILDAIHEKLPPLDDADGIVKESVTLTNLTPEQKKILPNLLKHASDNGIIDMSRPDNKKRQYVVISSEPVKKFLDGENIWIDSINKFEDYRLKITRLCDFITASEKLKSQEDKAESQISQLSDADTKRLCILENLKERWDFIPNDLQDDIPQHTYNSWQSKCDIDDYSQFKNILTTFKQSGLIESFDFIDESK